MGVISVFFESVGDAVVRWFDLLFAEGILVFLLAGMLGSLLGLFILIYSILQISRGPKVDGTVVGAVNGLIVRTVSEDGTVDGELVEKSSEKLYPVFEYTKSDGTKQRVRCSQGGKQRVLKYKTGQSVRLVVQKGESGDEDTAIDIEDRSGIWIGLIFALSGIPLIVIGGGDLLRAISSVGILAFLGIVASLLRRVWRKVGVGEILKARRILKDDEKEGRPPKSTRQVIVYLEDARPIEDFAAESTPAA